MTRAGLAAVGLALVVLVAGGLAAHGWQEAQRRDRGGAIFLGHAELPGRLAGHPSALPRLASRCQNCHEALDAASAANAASAGRDRADGSRAFASPLDRRWLSTPRSRHGGPATVYDAAALCALLRTGVDAGHVVVSTVMPRYEVSDAQCVDLHTYLLSR